MRRKENRKPLRLPRRPKSNLELDLQASDGQHVGVDVPGKQVVDRRAVQSGPLSERGHAAAGVDGGTQLPSDVLDVRDADGSISCDGPGQEVAVDVVPGPAEGMSTSGHHPRDYQTRSAPSRMAGSSRHTPGVPSDQEGVDPKRHNRTMMTREPTRSDAGIWTHQIIQRLAGEPTTPAGVMAASRAFFAASKVPKARWRGIRNTCGLAASLYLNQLRPPEGWELLAVELPLLASQADLVYCETESGRVVVDEATLTADALDPDLVDQVRRLTAGGVKRWRANFIGTRVLLLETPRRSWFQRPDGTRTELTGPRRWFE